jgi:hypothetical protein
MSDPGAAAEIGENEFVAFRHSLLLHLTAVDLDQETVGPLARLARTMTGTDPSTKAGLLAQFVDDEVATINTRVDKTWRERIPGLERSNPETYLDPNALVVAATISLAAGARQPKVHMAAGTALAIDDLVLFALTSSEILIPNLAALQIGDPKTQFELPERLTIAGDRHHRDDRFISYRDSITAAGLDHAQLTHAMAYNPWRLLQASILSELTIAWVLFHERAHWTLGHLDFIGRKTEGGLGLAEGSQELVGDTAPAASPEYSLSAENGTRRLKSETHQILEIQADAQAHLLLCDYAMRPGGAKDRFNGMAWEFDFPDDPRVLRELTNADCLRLTLTAAAIACLAFDMGRIERPVDKESTHPSPGARLMNMMINAPLISSLVQENQHGDWVLSADACVDADGNETAEFHALTQTGISMSLLDIWLLSDAIGATFTPLSPTENAAAKWEPSGWLNDLTTFWMVEDADDEPVPERLTEAGIELARLKPMDGALLPLLETLQIKRFGQPILVNIASLALTSP